MRTTRKESDKNRYQEIKSKKDQELDELVEERKDELVLDEDVEVDNESDLTGRLESKNITILPDGVYIGYIEKNHNGQVNVFHGDKLYYFDFGFNDYIFPTRCIYSIVVNKKKGYLSHRNHVFIRLNIENSINAKEKEIKSLNHIIKQLKFRELNTPKEIIDITIKNHEYQISKLWGEIETLSTVFNYLSKENDKLEKDCAAKLKEYESSLKDTKILVKEKKDIYNSEYLKFYGKSAAKIDVLSEPAELRFTRKLLRDAENLLKVHQGNIRRLDSIHKTLKL